MSALSATNTVRARRGTAVQPAGRSRAAVSVSLRRGPRWPRSRLRGPGAGRHLLHRPAAVACPRLLRAEGRGRCQCRRWSSRSATSARSSTGRTTFLPLINSAILSGGTAAITVVVSLFAAYPLSRYQMRFRKPFLYIDRFLYRPALTAILVPVYGPVRPVRPDRQRASSDPVHDGDVVAVRDLADEGLHGRRPPRPRAGGVGGRG